MANKKPAETRPEEEVYVYIGPNVQGVAQAGTVIAGTKEAALARIAPLVEKCPEAARLIVRDTALAEARAKLKKGGNAIASAYEAAAKA